ncbi:hypothetical protein NX059_011058 [Plenodomus lindquistii]|nr:hypothetical protein NX059_011058 [Plenodomus lindquistii]
MQLLQSLTTPCAAGPIDLHRGAILPVLHALSPMLLSLYYYRLNDDFCVRNFVFVSFLMSGFLQLVRGREPRALVLVAWWCLMNGLVPKGWWSGSRMRSVVEAIGRVVKGYEAVDPIIEHAFEGALRIAELDKAEDKEVAARCVFQNWDGVYWDDGPTRADLWELDQLLDLGDVNVYEVLGLATMTADELNMANLDIRV